MKTELKKWLLPWSYLILLLLIAEFFLRILQIPEYYLPTPSRTLETIITDWFIIWEHLTITITEAMIGFICGNVLAIVFGFFFSQWKSLRQGMYPIIVALQAVPIVAIAPFLIIWFGPGITGKSIMAGLICYFPAVVISTDGFSRVNREAYLLLKSMGASWSKIFKLLRIPSAIPEIFSALQVSATLCFVGAIVAELAGANKGIGFLILKASYEFRTAQLFAILAVTSLVTFGFFKIIQVTGKKYAKKYSFSYAQNSE